MPPRASTNKKSGQTNKLENVEIIVKGGSPVFGALVFVTFVLLVVAIVLQYQELTQFYDYEGAVLF